MRWKEKITLQGLTAKKGAVGLQVEQAHTSTMRKGEFIPFSHEDRRQAAAEIYLQSI